MESGKATDLTDECPPALASDLNMKGVQTMSQNEMITKIEALRDWENLMEEAKAEAEALRDSIKADMLEKGVEELTAGRFIVRWTSVLSTRFDSTAFRKAHSELYQEFTKQTSSRRFTVSA